RHLGRGEQRRAGKAVPERLRDRDHVGSDAVKIGGERLSDAAEPALHLIEDELRADLIAVAPQGLEIGLAQVDRACEALHGLDYDRGRAIGYLRGDRREVATGHEADIEGLPREGIPAVRAPG